MAAIRLGAESGDGVAELELLGFSVHAIATLENSEYELIFLRDLLQCTQDQLLSIHNFGWRQLTNLYKCLGRYHELAAKRQAREDALLRRAAACRSPDHFEPVPLTETYTRMVRAFCQG
jgi:uncharacterized protein YerC